MRRLRFTLAMMIMSVAVVAAPAAAVPARAAPANRAELSRALDEMVAAGAVGALAEVRDERGTWRGTSGVAELGRPDPVRTDSVLRIGSVTKTFVATVVLQLVAEGWLRLDDPIERWLPGTVPGGQDITLRHLLNHTSGLFDYLRALPMQPPATFLDIRWRTWEPRELVALATSQPPVAEPGVRYSYSNTNYILLGMVVQKATGQPYGVEVERRIIKPLGLRHTSVPGTFPFLIGPHPHGYLPVERDGEVRPVDITARNPSVMGAGGEMISTTAELNTFFTALINGRLLDAAELREMSTPPPGSDYGLGLRRSELTCGITAYGNDGDALGYQTWSFVTADGRRRVTLSVTPWGQDPDAAAEAFVDRALCDGPPGRH
jgi:D-alanyl-D-alanine carboxypeptidase